LLIDAIPGFEFPRYNLYDYKISVIAKEEALVRPEDFVIGAIWNELPDEDDDDRIGCVLVEESSFAAELNQEEINILAILMMNGWL
jgi:hypothetical protein